MRDRRVEARHSVAVVERKAEFRHHLAHMANGEVGRSAAPETEHVADRRQHHVLDLRAFKRLFQRAREILENDTHRRAGILELVLQLARRVQRVDVHEDKARTQDGSNRHQVLRHVRHHDRNAGAAW